jgi:hypothetical protein
VLKQGDAHLLVHFTATAPSISVVTTAGDMDPRYTQRSAAHGERPLLAGPQVAKAWEPWIPFMMMVFTCGAGPRAFPSLMAL